MAEQSYSWDPSEEEVVTPGAVVRLAKAIQKGPIVIMWNGDGFVAITGSDQWSPYEILSKLLEDLGVRR